MDREALLARPLVAVFAVVRPDGHVHASPLWFLYEAEAVHLIVERGSPRHRMAAQARRAAVCIEGVDPEGPVFVTAEGPVTVVDPLPVEVRFRMWERYAGSERAREVVGAGGDESKVLLVLRPETWIPSEMAPIDCHTTTTTATAATSAPVHSR